MPYADHNHTHQDHGSIIATYIGEDLKDGLSECPTRYRVIKVLDREEETEDDEEAEQRRESTDEMTPMGADHEAFRVSSDRCAEASNPVSVY